MVDLKEIIGVELSISSNANKELHLRRNKNVSKTLGNIILTCRGGGIVGRGLCRWSGEMIKKEFTNQKIGRFQFPKSTIRL